MEPKNLNAILLVEDDKSSCADFKKSMDDFFLNPFQLKVFTDGKSLLKFINQMVSGHNVDNPFLILLKVAPNKNDGLETLREIKTNARLKNYPVIIFSDSVNQDLVDECYDLHANSFMKKDADKDAFYSSIHSLLKFWFTVVVPPVPLKDN